MAQPKITGFFNPTGTTGAAPTGNTWRGAGASKADPNANGNLTSMGNLPKSNSTAPRQPGLLSQVANSAIAGVQSGAAKLLNMSSKANQADGLGGKNSTGSHTVGGSGNGGGGGIGGHTPVGSGNPYFNANTANPQKASETVQQQVENSAEMNEIANESQEEMLDQQLGQELQKNSVTGTVSIMKMISGFVKQLNKTNRETGDDVGQM